MTKTPSRPATSRAERQAAALRANLKRRKAAQAESPAESQVQSKTVLEPVSPDPAQAPALPPPAKS